MMKMVRDKSDLKEMIEVPLSASTTVSVVVHVHAHHFLPVSNRTIKQDIEKRSMTLETATRKMQNASKLKKEPLSVIVHHTSRTFSPSSLLFSS